MMNFVLSSFLGALKILDQEITVCYVKTRATVPLPVSTEDRDRIVNNLKFVSETCRRLSLSGAENRLDRISVAFNVGTSYQSLGTELTVLKQSIEDDVQYERFYHYPKSEGFTVLKVDADWQRTLVAFPSKEMRFEIQSGVDCYALGHPTAAIFHFMRVAEFGLRALARERRVRFPKYQIEWSNWQDLLTAIDNRVKQFARTARGSRKDAALEFYSGALAQFAGFKDQYRNSVMHVRRAYDHAEAEIAMRQVRDFMNGLSAKIGEGTKGPVRW